MADQPASDPAGVRCPKCGCQWHRVLYRRKVGSRYRRVRVCNSPICGHRFTTIETVGNDSAGK